MNPREWRIAEKLTLAQVAASVGVSGKNPASTYLRWETGRVRCPLSVIAKLERLSGGKVALADWVKLVGRVGGDAP